MPAIWKPLISLFHCIFDKRREIETQILDDHANSRLLRTFCLSLLSSSEGMLLDLLFVCLFVLVSRQGRGRYQSKRKNLFLTILCLVYIKFLSSGVPLLLLKLHFLLRYFKAKERERLLGLKGREHPAQTSFSAVFGSQCSSYAGSMHPYVSKFCLCAF